MDFHGVKVALMYGDKLVMHQRDSEEEKPGLFNAGMWDFPGGGREGSESPVECAIREIEEELSIILSPDDFMWEKTFPAQKDPTQQAVFMVAKLSKENLGKTDLTEGQRWQLFDQDSFFKRADVIDALKTRFHAYLESIPA